MSDAIGVAREGVEEIARVPQGVMRLLQQSYATRERHLDWLLALVAVGAVVYAFWPQICDGVKQGKAGVGTNNPDSKPNDDIKGALSDNPSVRLYTYNLPAARNFAPRRGPTVVPTPQNPSFSPAYPVDEENFRDPSA